MECTVYGKKYVIELPWSKWKVIANAEDGDAAMEAAENGLKDGIKTIDEAEFSGDLDDLGGFEVVLELITRLGDPAGKVESPVPLEQPSAVEAATK